MDQVGFEVTDCMIVKLEQGPWRRWTKCNGEEQAKSWSMNQQGHMATWSGSYHSRKVKPSFVLYWWSSGSTENGRTSCNGQWQKVVWLATTIDDHCSSFDEDGSWMLVQHCQHENEMECARQRYICRAFHFTGLRLSREELDWVYDRWLFYQEGFSCELIDYLVPLGEI